MNQEEQNQQIQELFLLQRVAQRINSILELDVLLEEIVGDVAETFGYTRSGVLLKDDVTNELVIAAVRGWTTNYHLKGERFKIGEYGMIGHVAATGETYYAPDVTIDPYYQVSEELTRSEVDIPLKIRGRLIGVFSTQHNETDAFSPERIQLLEALAGHMATAIKNARLFHRERLEKQRALVELDKAHDIKHSLFPKQSPTISRADSYKKLEREKWEQIKDIFDAALQRAPDEREQFLAENCNGDEELRREVQALLSSSDGANSFLQKPAIGEIADVIESGDKKLEAGKRFVHYQILKLLGAGGMGEVFLAEDTKLDRKVAVKFLNEEFARDADKLRRFVQEAKAASALNHPNILTVYEIGEVDGKNYIAAEFIEGKTLREQFFGKESLPLGSVLHFGIQISEALAAAHRAGIVHRDIKPENIMVRADDYVKVLDFGLAKLTETKAAGGEDRTLVHSNPGMILGTVAYMSPEQARGQAVDARTDIWSFGVLLYEMLARRAPFAGETATDVMLSIIQKEPPALQLFAPALPNELYFIVGKLLRKKADERYQSIGDVLTDLRRIKQRLEYEEIEKTLSPENSKARMPSQEHQTAILNQQPKQSSDSGEAISTISTTSSGEKLPPNNLSAELATLIGRDAEIEEITNLLKQPDIRLLTMTGVGGTGKTSLAQSVARASLHEFTDGTYFINLSAIETADLVVPIIAQTLGVQEESGKSLKEKLGEFLSERKILLVLDNFEQITEAASAVGELLSESKNLKILVTSRVRLYLRFEREFVLQPLAVPTDKRLSLRELSEYAAVVLFVERARAAKSGFELTEENASSVAEICRRLDGLPLAMELAAARIKLLAPQAILTRLSSSLKLLTGGARDLPERQQTMRGAIRWSYDLLEAEEKLLLNRLAVFAGGLTLDAAEAVANAAGDLSVDLLDGISSLVDKSLLVQREMADGEPRFRMLEVVREFALEALAASGESGEIKRLHAGFFAQLAETAAPELLAGKTAEWLETLEQEHDNLRFALEWSLENEPETALRIVGAIFRFWVGRGYLSEGGKWTQAALERNGEQADATLRVTAYYGIGILSWRQGDLEAAEQFEQESLRLAREIDNKDLIARALGGLGNVKNQQGDLIQAKALIEESLEIARELNDGIQISMRLNNLGEFARQQEDYEAARKFYEEALTLARKESSKSAISVFTLNLAAVACFQGDYKAARLYALEGLKISEELGDKISTGNALGIFAALAVAAGEMEKAARLFGAARAIYDAIGSKSEKVDQIFFDRYTEEARAAIGDEAFEAAFSEGKAMRLKKAIALAHETD